MNKRVAISIT